MLMITPPAPRSFMWRYTGRVTQKVPFRCTETTMSQSSSVMFEKDLSRRIPALLTSTSTCSKASSAVFRMFSPPSTEATLS